MTINGTDISTYGGVLLGTPRISNAEIAPDYRMGRARSGLIFHNSAIGAKVIECSIAITGSSVHEIQLRRARLRALMLGKLDISFGTDGFSYWAVYDGSAELESEYSGAVVSKFRFIGVQHEAKVTVTGATVNCSSTVPETDCKLTVTATAAASTFTLGTVTFSSVSSGDVLVADGINGIITRNGTAVSAAFTRLPYLVSGAQTITCTNGTPTIEYYPTHL